MDVSSTPRKNMIEVVNLGKYFHDKKKDLDIKAVDGISFEIKRGEIFGFLGPNGAGKTTTMRLLAGLLKPNFGTARVNGLDISDDPDEIRKYIGFLTETHGNYEDLTVGQNLEFFGGFYGVQDLPSRIQGVLQELKLEDRVDMKVGKLSKGLKQRAALARVLVHDPPVLFLDEPTAGLDPVASVKVRDLIRDLKSQNRTIFINSHNLEEVQKVCDRVAIIDRGKLKRIGTPTEISRNLWEAQELTCTLKPPLPPNLIREIQAIDKVKNVTLVEHTLRVQLTDIDDVTPLIATKLVQINGQILEISRTKHSLEDIYLRLMGEEELLEETTTEEGGIA